MIEPITRIYGNAGIKIMLQEDGRPREVHFHAFGYRGLEQATRGAHLDSLLPIVSRICGVDSLFHQIAAAAAVEKALGIEVPEEALRLRELAMWGQLFERHAVSLTIHSLPDLLFPSSGPALRSIISIHKVDEEVVKRVMALKSLGTSILQEAGGRAVHPVNFVIGGCAHDISTKRRGAMLEKLEEARPLLMETAHLMKLLLRRNEEAVKALGTNPSSYLALEAKGPLPLLGSVLRAKSADGEDLGSFDAGDLPGRLVENNSTYSHIRNVELAGVGQVRVGPLARLNINNEYGTPLADEELDDVRSQWNLPLHQTMLSHMARILEMIHAWEMMEELLNQPPGEVTRSRVTYMDGRGVSIVEAPEGLLVYTIEVSEEGLIKETNFVAPLQFNLKALEGSLGETAAMFIGPGESEERATNFLEMAVRAYAPCPLCGLH